MRIDNDAKLDFDDVLIRPKRSEAPSRSAIIREREHRFLHSGATWKGIPIVVNELNRLTSTDHRPNYIRSKPC